MGRSNCQRRGKPLVLASLPRLAEMPLRTMLLRWLTTGALPVAAAVRRAATSSSTDAVAVLPEAARRIIVNELSFSAILPRRRNILNGLTAASPSATFKRWVLEELNATSISASLSLARRRNILDGLTAASPSSTFQRWVLEELNATSISASLSLARRNNLNAAAASATMLRRIIFEHFNAPAEAFSSLPRRSILAEINVGSLSAAVGRETVRLSPSSMSISSGLDMLLPEETLFDVVLHASRVNRVAESAMVFLLRPLQHGAATSSARVWAPCATQGAQRLSSSPSASPSPPGLSSVVHQATATSSARVWAPCATQGSRRLSSSPSASPSPPGLPSVAHKATATATGPGCSTDSSPPTDSSSQCQAQQQLIDEATPEEFFDAETYLKSHRLMVQDKVLGSGALFWRMSDDAGYLIRPIAKILKKYHAIGYYLSGPLSVSNILVSESGKVRLRNVKFVEKDSSLEHLNQDYSYLAQLIKKMVIISNGARRLKKIPIDFKNYINLLEGNKLEEKDEFWIVNHTSLLPMCNRGYVFLMFYDHVDRLGRNNSKLKKEIIDKMPYEQTWIKTALKNKKLRKWLAHRWYKRTKEQLLDFIRNVLSHRYEHIDEEIEETLYCEWPELLEDMQKALHREGELVKTEIESKFGR